MPPLSRSSGPIDNERRLFGVYAFGAPSEPRSIENIEEVLNRRIDIVSIYQAWDSEHAAIAPPPLNRQCASGRIPLITWEPWSIREPGRPSWDQPRFSLSRILAGDHDVYIERCAKIFSELPGPVWLRPMHEMNGNWYPWCGAVNANTPTQYVNAWRYLHDALAHTHVTWVWSPYTHSYPDVPGNESFAYYPGDKYVDWLAVDGYNWGSGDEGNGWETFGELFGDTYAQLLGFCDKPIMIAETACAETGGDKALWIADMFEVLVKDLDRVRALVWFNALKERDWRLDSSPAGLRSFKQGLRSFR